MDGGLWSTASTFGSELTRGFDAYGLTPTKLRALANSLRGDQYANLRQALRDLADSI